MSRRPTPNPDWMAARFIDRAGLPAAAPRAIVTPESRMWVTMLRNEFAHLEMDKWDRAFDVLDWIAAGGLVVQLGLPVAELVGVPQADLEMAAVRILRERRAREAAEKGGPSVDCR